MRLKRILDCEDAGDLQFTTNDTLLEILDAVCVARTRDGAWVKAKRAVSNLGILLGSADGLLLRLANRPGVVSELLFKILALPCARKHLALRKQAPPTKSTAHEGEETDEALADEPFSKWVVSQVKDIPGGAERIIGKFSALSSVIEAVKYSSY